MGLNNHPGNAQQLLNGQLKQGADYFQKMKINCPWFSRFIFFSMFISKSVFYKIYACHFH